MPMGRTVATFKSQFKQSNISEVSSGCAKEGILLTCGLNLESLYSLNEKSKGNTITHFDT